MEASNVKAMRDALVMVKRIFDGRLMWQTDIRKAHESVNSALTAPPRNCDVGTEEEQRERFFKFCTPQRCDECKSHEDDSFYGCVLRWSQMQYEEVGVEMKTNTKKNKLTDWDWTTLVAAWRYYEHRNTITAAKSA